MDRYFVRLRAALLAAAENVSFFVFVSFVFSGILSMSPLDAHRGAILLLNEYLLVPWGAALCLLRLERSVRMQRAPGRDVGVLFVLLLWIIVPFALRFGVTFNNVGAWYNHTLVYFGVYAFLREKPEPERERLLDLLVRLCGGLSLLLGGALLLCAAFAVSFGGGGGYPFGLVYDAAQGTYHLIHGIHYNITGMVCLCLAMLCLCGAARAGRRLSRMAYLCGAAMMFAVIILSQSRTARYAAILALAAGAFGCALRLCARRGRAVRVGAAALAAVLVLAGAFAASSAMTDCAMKHFARVQSGEGGESPAADVLVALGMTDAAQEPLPPQAQDAQARDAVDATFSDRTTIWANLFALWRENPRHLLIGNGIGRTGSRIVAGTIHEAAGAVQVHNTYLQHTADFGLIGSALLALFFLTILRPVLRVFFAAGERHRPGYMPLCMLVIACLATGMMESAPLGALTTMNLMLFFVLALLASRGEALDALVKEERDMV